MLIQFTVKNYRSIKEEQVFSMVKAKGDELLASNTFEPSSAASEPLLRSAVIYGANAAGKSNLIRALIDMESIVTQSASYSQEGDELPVTPFLFDDSTVDEPTEFEAVFIMEGVKYQYGFSATAHRVLEEWLIAYPKVRPQRWFSRVFDEEIQEYDYKFSDYLTGQKTVWQNTTRANALFLSTAVQLNSEQLKPVFNWFKDKLRPSNVIGWGPGFTASLCDNENTRKKILNFLQSADFNIHDIDIKKEKFDPNSIPDILPETVKEQIIKDMKGRDIIDIKTVHRTNSGKSITLDFDEESDGTQKFFSFAGPWMDVLENGYVLVIDELHDSLHPKMVKYLVNLFHSNKTNPKNAQLIFTTHETSILNQDVFRRDQIWFCEKNSSQETSLYPLTDFSPRKDRENLELGYLSGRYGALPFIKSISSFEG
ncbi:ATP-binding protein [Vibrio furnissii]|uniref:AAA family ATPase n=2 Tax=Vibrio furnissii TaxID=29494 RepID=UPI001C9D0A46|nr:ATP-binding protein [Vibrio furnissii]EKO3988880.1 ATP-binding protein [Vibrio fluvialis]MBY7919103.1 ATP-binding protein [Vibrio fluvialis]MBY7953493.1 ATP-binding protein [Vibrio fluvialis]MBY8154599.1 ATP-binding protein [Vibrio fluvialis]MBY8243627.1 ATP-binding protein [Vibrio fluvialis]